MDRAFSSRDERERHRIAEAPEMLAADEGANLGVNAYRPWTVIFLVKNDGTARGEGREIKAVEGPPNGTRCMPRKDSLA